MGAKKEGSRLVSSQAQGWKVCTFTCLHPYVLATSCLLRLHNPGLDSHTTIPRHHLNSANPSLQAPLRLSIHRKHFTQTSTYHTSTMAIGIFTILAGLVALAAGYFYLFGISPEMKRKMEKQALKTMGENKMSYMAKGASAMLTAALTNNARPILTPLRLHQQDSLLRPRRRQEPEEGHQQLRGWCHAEPHWRASG